jgi:hypothetical protein
MVLEYTTAPRLRDVGFHAHVSFHRGASFVTPSAAYSDRPAASRASALS